MSAHLARRSQRDRFLEALKRLQDWHCDAVKAQTYDGPSVSSGKATSSTLQTRSYPSTQAVWDLWRADTGYEARERLIAALEAEFETIGRRRPTVRYRDHWGKTRFKVAPTASSSTTS